MICVAIFAPAAVFALVVFRIYGVDTYQTPSLPDAHPRLGHFRCGGRKSNLLADRNFRNQWARCGV
jgi:hypothetical protein